MIVPPSGVRVWLATGATDMRRGVPSQRRRPGLRRDDVRSDTTHGQDRWLEELRQELLAGDYRPRPLLRVWIPKSNGGQRSLGIPCIRDRVVEMAALLVLGPIFEADLLPNQYGFRPGMDAKMAVRQAFWHVSDHARSEVVDLISATTSRRSRMGRCCAV